MLLIVWLVRRKKSTGATAAKTGQDPVSVFFDDNNATELEQRENNNNNNNNNSNNKSNVYASVAGVLQQGGAGEYGAAPTLDFSGSAATGVYGAAPTLDLDSERP